MGALVLLVILMLGLVVGVPAYAAVDWYFSYRERETFKEYLKKF